MEESSTSERNQWLETARKDFEKYCKSTVDKMTFEEFDKFYEEFLPTEIKRKYPATQFFKDFSKNKIDLEKQEFENVWEELNLFRTETKDSI